MSWFKNILAGALCGATNVVSSGIKEVGKTANKVWEGIRNLNGIKKLKQQGSSSNVSGGSALNQRAALEKKEQRRKAACRKTAEMQTKMMDSASKEMENMIRQAGVTVENFQQGKIEKKEDSILSELAVNQWSVGDFVEKTGINAGNFQSLDDYARNVIGNCVRNLVSPECIFDFIEKFGLNMEERNKDLLTRDYDRSTNVEEWQLQSGLTSFLEENDECREKFMSAVGVNQQNVQNLSSAFKAALHFDSTDILDKYLSQSAKDEVIKDTLANSNTSAAR